MVQTISEPTIQVPRLQEADLPPLPPLLLLPPSLPPTSPTIDPLKQLSSLWGNLTRLLRFGMEERAEPIESQIIRTAPLDETPPWLERRWENMKNSRFYQLPDEIIIMIRDQADYPTRILLRQSCFLLLRIVSDLDRTRPSEKDDPVWRAAVAKYFNGRLLLPIHGTAREFESRRHEWREIVYRDIVLDLCSGCRAHRQSPEFKSRLNKLGQFVDCSSCCCFFHMRLLACKRQNESSPIKYKCIIQESPLQLCSHLSFSPYDLCLRQYRVSPYRGKDCAWTCLDKQHDDQSPTIKGYKIRPFLSVTEGEKTTFAWISPAFDLDPRVPVTRQHLRDFVKSQKVASGLAFCPHVHAQDERLLLPFEPDQCACFDHDDDIASKSSAGRYHCHDLENGEENCCRCYSQQHSEEKGRFLVPDHDISHGKQVSKSLQSGAKQRAMFASTLHEYKCAQCFAIYAWVRGRDERVYLRCRRDLDISIYQSRFRCATQEWASMNDLETYRITWCDDPECKTGKLWTRLFIWPKAEMHLHKC